MLARRCWSEGFLGFDFFSVPFILNFQVWHCNRFGIVFTYFQSPRLQERGTKDAVDPSVLLGNCKSIGLSANFLNYVERPNASPGIWRWMRRWRGWSWETPSLHYLFLVKMERLALRTLNQWVSEEDMENAKTWDHQWKVIAPSQPWTLYFKD